MDTQVLHEREVVIGMRAEVVASLAIIDALVAKLVDKGVLSTQDKEDVYTEAAHALQSDFYPESERAYLDMAILHILSHGSIDEETFAWLER